MPTCSTEYSANTIYTTITDSQATLAGSVKESYTELSNF